MADGVIPSDTGALGHAAERVLKHQLPHRDFDGPYTGLLSMVNAGAFRCFGVSIQSMRLPLIPLSVAGFLTLYGLMRHTLSIGSALVTTLAAFVWSVPNYFSPMPSWYNLFLALFGAAALLRYARTSERTMLLIAGACCGVSLLFKVVGLYFAASAALFVIFAEQLQTELHPSHRTPRATIGSGVIIGGLVAFVAAAGWLLLGKFRLVELIVFVLPPTLLAQFLIWNEFRLRHCDAKGRFWRIARAGACFAVGFCVPVALFLIPYFATRSVDEWLVGVFVTPFMRLSHSEFHRPLQLDDLLVGALIVVLSCLMMFVAIKPGMPRLGRALPWLWSVAVIVAGGIATVNSGVWSALRLVPLAAAIVLVCMLYRQRHDRRTAEQQQTDAQRCLPLFLMVAVASTFNWVQFPLAHGIYLLYAAPVLIAAGGMALALLTPRRVWPTACLGIGLAVFAIVWVARGAAPLYGERFEPDNRDTIVRTSRGAIYYDRPSARAYEALIEEIDRHASPGEPILALPDFPEAYFFSGHPNATRTFYDIFDQDYGSPNRDRRLLAMLDKRGVRVIVMKNFSPVSQVGLPDRLRAELRRRFPHQQRIFIQNKPMLTVRWRNAVPASAKAPVGVRQPKSSPATALVDRLN
ncbi:MAG: hypothetical protein JSS27_19575 [Planctomycetes bacterium]|nr:hypothetical protein [Planctomycetota bacterium]